MSFDLDEDILQDFLIEAGEILELLSEQLVELERRPDDAELLNAIFRGFHTVKGGAGFLSLTALVDACHGAENIFDLLRTGKRTVNAELMDVILQALDTINVMFGQVQDREPVDPAEPALLEALHRFSLPPTAEELQQAAAPAVEVVAETVVETVAETVTVSPVVEPVAAPVIAPVATPAVDDSAAIAGDSVDDMTQDEFDRLLDELHGIGRAPGAEAIAPVAAPETPAASAFVNNDLVSQIQSETGDITDDEFERLLDELHGAGKGPGCSDFTTQVEPVADVAPVNTAPASAPASMSMGADGDDLMTDDEFERLLDELHGSGKGPSAEELDFATNLLPTCWMTCFPVPIRCQVRQRLKRKMPLMRFLRCQHRLSLFLQSLLPLSQSLWSQQRCMRHKRQPLRRPRVLRPKKKPKWLMPLCVWTRQHWIPS
ncbi:signal transduction histidine kinase CheA [Photobacterium aphoticum]|uniref:Signal transduction histidine kinase CheA n=1 Tax=Photobacterium aphoticum TaxID=754436 RepID=A0A090QZW7_9GAMM|nr:signal transduction histidine kinase CheA [Photobacterium aphoticum]